MATYLTNTEELTLIADAIREKTGGEDPMVYPEGFVSEIGTLELAVPDATGVKF